MTPDTTVFVDSIVELKRSIARAAADALTAFEQKTGISPCEVSIHMCDVSNLGSSLKSYVVGEVTVNLGRF